MNKVLMMGRVSKDIEVRYSQAAEPMAVVKFSIAVARKFKKQGEPDADFFNCVAFGKTGENIEKFFSKGRMIMVVGTLKTGSYEKDGRKIYTTDIVVDEFFFTGEKKDDAPTTGATQASAPTNGFYAIDQDLEMDDMPFL